MCALAGTRVGPEGRRSRRPRLPSPRVRAPRGEASRPRSRSRTHSCTQSPPAFAALRLARATGRYARAFRVGLLTCPGSRHPPPPARRALSCPAGNAGPRLDPGPPASSLPCGPRGAAVSSVTGAGRSPSPAATARAAPSELQPECSRCGAAAALLSTARSPLGLSPVAGKIGNNSKIGCGRDHGPRGPRRCPCRAPDEVPEEEHVRARPEEARGTGD